MDNVDYEGATILHFASAHGYIELTRYLLSQGTVQTKTGKLIDHCRKRCSESFDCILTESACFPCVSMIRLRQVPCHKLLEQKSRCAKYLFTLILTRKRCFCKYSRSRWLDTTTCCHLLDATRGNLANDESKQVFVFRLSNYCQKSPILIHL